MITTQMSRKKKAGVRYQGRISDLFYGQIKSAFFKAVDEFANYIIRNIPKYSGESAATMIAVKEAVYEKWSKINNPSAYITDSAGAMLSLINAEKAVTHGWRGEDVRSGMNAGEDKFELDEGSPWRPFMEFHMEFPTDVFEMGEGGHLKLHPKLGGFKPAWNLLKGAEDTFYRVLNTELDAVGAKMKNIFAERYRQWT